MRGCRAALLAAVPRLRPRLELEHRTARARVYRLTRSLPLGRRQAEQRWYSTPKTYSAHYLPGTVGAVVGTERHAGRGQPGVLCFGPYVSLPAGRYEVTFTLRVDVQRHSFGAVYGDLRVSTQTGELIAERAILKSDFPSGPARRSLTLPFTLDQTTHMRKLEFSVNTTGVSRMRVSRIRLVPLR